MKTPIVLDFETYYDADYTLRKLSTPEYIFDERFLVFGLAIDDGKGQEFVRPNRIEKVLRQFKAHPLVFHNSYFDAGILKWRYKYSPAFIIDTLGLANHVFGAAMGGEKNDLASVAERLGIEAKGTMPDIKGVRELSPEQWSDLDHYAKKDARVTRKVLDKLLPWVTNPDFELWLLDHTIRIYTDKLLDIDRVKVAAAIKLVEKRRVEKVKAAAVPAAVLSSNPQFAAELAKRLKAAKISMPMKMSKPRKKTGKAERIPALAKGDHAFLSLAESPAKAVADLVVGRIVERSATSALARLRRMEKYAAIGGIPVHLSYYGAHTGRFAGAGGFNFQNLTSPNRATDAFDREVATAIRAAITPGDGRAFVADDAAQIEARVLAWLAGEQQILDAFASGADIYSMFISDALGEDIHKPTDADPKERRPYLSLMRQAGKESILGLGFSMGVDKFIERLKKDKNILPHVSEKGKLNPAVCASLVETYRTKYTRIVDFWGRLNSAMQLAIRGGTRSVGKLVFRREEARTVSIELPSGRKLYYRNLRQINETTKGGKVRKVWVHGAGQRLYGGLLAENVTQAVARDILVETIYDAEQAGYPVVLHVHDEIVCRVPKARGKQCLAFLDESLRTPPSWGDGLVLGSEGHVSGDLSK